MIIIRVNLIEIFYIQSLNKNLLKEVQIKEFSLIKKKKIVEIE